MVKVAQRLAGILTWLVVIVLVTAAVVTASMRLVLPNLDAAKAPIQRWASQESGFHVEFSTFQGHWRYLLPSLSLHDFTLSTNEGGHSVLSATSIEMQFDLLASFQRREPTFTNVSIDGLAVDLTQLPERNTASDKSGSLATQLENLFLVGLGQFAIHDASVTVLSPSDERKTINIESLRWDNQSSQHRVQGVVSVEGTSLNQVDIRGVFTESDGLASLSGDFYLNAEDVSLKAWIAKFINPDVALSKAKVAGQAWLTVENGMPKTALVSLTDSVIAWGAKAPTLQTHDTSQSVSIRRGQILLERSGDNNWRVATEDFAIKTGKVLWPEPKLRADISRDAWAVNLAALDLSLLLPLRHMFVIPDDVEHALTSLSLTGNASDIRLAKPKTSDIAYSVDLDDVAFQHWSYLPEVHKLHVSLAGVGTNGKATLVLEDDILPYGEFFQAPLPIEQGDVTAYWDYTDERVVVWSDNVAVRSPDLNVVGEFRLDIPFEGSSWLSFYAEANAKNAGETWRYLPTLALGYELTDYLSSAIRGGQADHAKLVWYGDFNTFPYPQHEGMFQAYVPLKNAKFSFDTQWPMLTDLDLNLLFQNDSLFLDASNVGLMAARGYDLKGEIPSLSNENGQLLIDAKIASNGNDLHEYMLATPLVDSVGAALTHVQVNGEVEGEISLSIPLNGDDVDVQGSASLGGNQVAIASPEIVLNNVTGTMSFDNDVVWAKKLKAQLLDQPVNIGFKGEAEAENYLVNIDIDGQWEGDKLKAALELPDLQFIEGRSAWDLGVDIALKDIGFTYDVLLDADLTHVDINLPAPLNKPSLVESHGRLKASGNERGLVGQIELPQLKYQADVDISGDRPTVIRSRTVVGDGELSLKPLSGDAVSVDVPVLDVMAWKNIITHYELAQEGKKHDFPVNMSPPSRVNVKASKVLADELTFNQFSLAARRKSDGFHILVGSEELSGDAWWDEDDLLTVSIEHLFLNVDIDDDTNEKAVTPATAGRKATDIDRILMSKIPSTDLVIDELWLQGYRVGRIESQLLKTDQKLTLSKFKLASGNTRLTANGGWEISHDGINKSHLAFGIQGHNSSDLMGRFSVTGGIQDASVKTSGNLTFDGAPWSLDITTLNGTLETRLEDGYVSGVGGAGRLLGLFSLDSILRKMQLDFTGVFEDGLAFDEISGSASITNGVIVTDNIQMKALAGDMFIKGIANLEKNQVNAEVRFIPDLTSGIPILTAFAVAPQTALYVLAVTTVLSPVVDAFTQVRYQVTGSIDEPIVREVSRITGEVTLPEQATERLRNEQKGSNE
ncbi:TIGR02099 family protein [Enterovibrio sp. ZSDZ42]|uniref:TIGR02099 family protein n=1 Tax=Enterovibrio gelatinilyticus TaxID=2899819 RepID=A0ABT5QVK5_9GAMM|nr:YhdP family protein [Enterovibrio sp. ZSDZ42]MDD1792043.1 TIGR02099 family protein [Enterovibrio sp. ZSDZ42]